jgi:hypothetical protein
MDKNELTTLILMEFENKISKELKNNPKGIKEFLQNNIDQTLLGDLINEFCEKNPGNFDVLNPLTISKDANETITSLEYKKIINNAGLAYQCDELTKLL